MGIQKKLFEEIKNRLDPNLRLADTIGDILKIGSDSTYRRLRGEKQLSLLEVVKLCDAFNLSIDALINHQPDQINFKFSTLDFNNPEKYNSYLQQLTKLYQSILSVKNKNFLISAQDIPIFHFMPFTELTFFKLFALNQSISSDFFYFEDFVDKLDHKLLSGYYNQIYDAFLKIPSTEVWSIHTTEPLLNLLEYNIDLDSFRDKKTAILLCQQFLQLIEKVESIAKENKKTHKGLNTEYNLYLSPLDMQNDFIVTTKDNLSVTSVKLFTVNAIFTSDNTFTSETEKWIRHIISKSSLISGTSERERFKFFHGIKAKINTLIESIEV